MQTVYDIDIVRVIIKDATRLGFASGFVKGLAVGLLVGGVLGAVFL